MDDTKLGRELVNVVLWTWAEDAAPCPVCGTSWTVHRIEVADARVISVDPRLLACADCLIRRGAKAVRAELGLKD